MEHESARRGWEMDDTRIGGEFSEQDRQIVLALRNAGVEIECTYDLFQGPTPPGAVPVLIEMLPKIRHPYLRDAIVRGLATEEARGVAERALLDEFYSERSDDLVKLAIGCTIEYLMDRSLCDEVLKVVQDKKHGRTRWMFVQALGKVEGDPRVVDVLIQLLKDEEVAFDAMVALEKLRAKKALPYLEPFLNHPKMVLRNRARRTIAAIEGAAEEP
jgi:hypothetical protein